MVLSSCRSGSGGENSKRWRATGPDGVATMSASATCTEPERVVARTPDPPYSTRATSEFKWISGSEGRDARSCSKMTQ